MTFVEAMSLLKLRKTVRREGRTLRLYPVGFFDVGAERRTEISEEDRKATDWEAVES